MLHHTHNNVRSKHQITLASHVTSYTSITSNSPPYLLMSMSCTYKHLALGFFSILLQSLHKNQLLKHANMLPIRLLCETLSTDRLMYLPMFGGIRPSNSFSNSYMYTKEINLWNSIGIFPTILLIERSNFNK